MNAAKKCSRCGILKDMGEYHKEKRARDGHTSQCNACSAIDMKKHYLANRTLRMEYSRKWYAANKRRVLMRDRRNREALNAWHEQWVKNNYARWREINNKAGRKRRATARGKINHSVSTLVRRSLKGGKGGCGWESLVGYSVAELKAHLEKLFTPEMTWENYGTFWQIDHKIPRSVFNFEKQVDIDFKRCWALDNLQPLEARENNIKKAKLSGPFQPSLLVEA